MKYRTIDRYGFDFDGTVVQFRPGSWEEYAPDKFGEEIPRMIARMKRLIRQGKDVVIFTARVHPDHEDAAEVSRAAIQKWSLKVFGKVLEVTCMKDPNMVQIFDDRAVTVEKNTGRILTKGMEDEEIESSDAIGSFFGV